MMTILYALVGCSSSSLVVECGGWSEYHVAGVTAIDSHQDTRDWQWKPERRMRRCMYYSRRDGTVALKAERMLPSTSISCDVTRFQSQSVSVTNQSPDTSHCASCMNHRRYINDTLRPRRVADMYSAISQHTPCLKKTTLMQRTITSTHINLYLVIFHGDVADRACYRMMICYPTSPY